VCCEQEKEIVLEQYHFTECGLGNVYLLFCKGVKCACGVKGVLIPLNLRELYKPIVWELTYNKPTILSSLEFVGILKYLFNVATEDDDFAREIEFQNRDLIKNNDFLKFIELKTDDVIINEECAKEIRNCLALKLGLSGEKELLQIGRERPVTQELDRKLRKLSRSEVGEIQYGHASQINHHSGNQIIYVDMGENI
jgi:hypothetical protein